MQISLISVELCLCVHLHMLLTWTPCISLRFPLTCSANLCENCHLHYCYCNLGIPGTFPGFGLVSELNILYPTAAKVKVSLTLTSILLSTKLGLLRNSIR